MRNSRVFADQPLATGTRIDLAPTASHYLLKVLRLRCGASLTIFNGGGSEFAATLVDDRKGVARIELGVAHKPDRESPLSIHLGIGMAKGERMDSIVRKAVELGVASIAPLVTERSEVRLDRERVDKKHRHWQQVAISACEQCGRNRVPVVSAPAQIDAWLATSPAPGLTLDPEAAASLRGLAKPTALELCLLIGPEGGLSRSERAASEACGFTPVRLGPRILRVETAPLAAISVLQFLWGDLA